MPLAACLSARSVFWWLTAAVWELPADAIENIYTISGWQCRGNVLWRGLLYCKICRWRKELVIKRVGTSQERVLLVSFFCEISFALRRLLSIWWNMGSSDSSWIFPHQNWNFIFFAQKYCLPVHVDGETSGEKSRWVPLYKWVLLPSSLYRNSCHCCGMVWH